MAIEIFNRYELKFMLSAAQKDQLIESILPYMDCDDFNAGGKPYSINNIYYDTYTDDLITASLQKPLYKEKLRVRGYGVPSLNDNVYVEIKKKYKGLVNKRRTSFELGEAYKFLETQQVQDESKIKNKQVLEELKYFLKVHPIFPRVFLGYDRFAYFSKEDKNFRITLDTNIRSRRFDLHLEDGAFGYLLLPRDKWLMEVKISNTMPIWFAEIINKLDIKHVSFSKYGTEFNNFLLNKGNENGFFV